VIYDLRLFALEGGEDLKGEVWEMIEQALRATVAEYVPEGTPRDDWNLSGLRQRIVLDYFLVVQELPQEEGEEHSFQSRDEIEDLLIEAARVGFKRKLESWGDAHRERILSWIMLGVIDEKWRDHLYDLDHLKASIGFRGWGQKDPLIEYKQEAYTMFKELMADLQQSIATLTFRAQLAVPQPRPQPRRLTLTGPSETPDTRPSTAQPIQRAEQTETDPLASAMGGARRRWISPPPSSARPTVHCAGLPPLRPASWRSSTGSDRPPPRA
jgi:preprotein translocase subunit SecA